MKTVAYLFLTAALIASSGALAGGDPKAGESKAQACFACHGQDGNGISPTYPRLAGQYESYMTKALIDYKSGARANAIMAGMVANLSEQDMADISAYYASKDGLEDLSIK
ncbi:MAG: hypothetical protein DHS20C11_32240 [Lysobacteraceae bacterium]|nr:MAG: hypothetical protein DHS20C11_32240 [Xanthomonadaceae bacterium]